MADGAANQQPVHLAVMALAVWRGKRRRHGRAVRPSTWFGAANEHRRATPLENPCLLQVVAISDSSLWRRCVDGRVKPVMPATAQRDKPPNARPNAIRAVQLFAQSRKLG
jgi:hypothetical protein